MKVLNNAGDQIRIKHDNGTDSQEGPGIITINELSDGRIQIWFDSTYHREVEHITEKGNLIVSVSKPIGLL